MFLAILPSASRALSKDRRGPASAIEGGAAFALAIALGYTLSYLLLEAGRTHTHQAKGFTGHLAGVLEAGIQSVVGPVRLLPKSAPG